MSDGIRNYGVRKTLFCKNSNHNKGCFEELDASPSEETDPSPNNGKGKDKAVDPWEQ